MPAKRRIKRGRRPEHLVRQVSITGVSAGVSFSAGGRKGEEPYIASNARVELTGTMDEPIRGISEVEMVVYAADEPRPGKDPAPWIGLVHGVKPVIRPAIFVSHRDFDRVLTLAVSGQLKHVHLVMILPRYQTALVTSVSFSTHLEE